jgi:hypothetical protein
MNIHDVSHLAHLIDTVLKKDGMATPERERLCGLMMDAMIHEELNKPDPDLPGTTEYKWYPREPITSERLAKMFFDISKQTGKIRIVEKLP